MIRGCKHKTRPNFGIVLIPILKDQTRITSVIRDKDGDWQILDDITPRQQEYATLVCGECIIDLLERKELKDLANMPAAHRADLLTEDGPWVIRHHKDC